MESHFIRIYYAICIMAYMSMPYIVYIYGIYVHMPIYYGKGIEDARLNI